MSESTCDFVLGYAAFGFFTVIFTFAGFCIYAFWVWIRRQKWH
jgi:hypothetical protein